MPGTGDPPGAVHDSLSPLAEKENITQCAGFLLGAIGCKWQYPESLLFFPLKFFLGKLGDGSLGVHLHGLIAENDVSLLAAALRIQVGLTQLFENFWVESFDE